jgi:hypothetical protein
VIALIDFVENGVNDMNVVLEVGGDHWKAIWSHFEELCSLEDLKTLRRVCVLFHSLVGTSFILAGRFKVFPTESHSLEDVLKSYRAIEAIQSPAFLPLSIPDLQWPFSVVQMNPTNERALAKTNATILHLNAIQPLQREEILSLPCLTTLTACSTLAFSCLQPNNYASIHTIAILPSRENLFSAYFQRLKHNPNLVVELNQNDTSPDLSPFVAHFSDMLLLNGFTSLERVSLACSSWEEMGAILAALSRRESLSEFSKLTHLMLIGMGDNFTIPPDISLLPELLVRFPSLEELWLDPSISCTTTAESLDFKNIRSFQANFDCDPPICLCIGGNQLQYLRLQVSDQSIITIDPISRNLQSIDVDASIQAISFLLSSLESSPPPNLSNITFVASMSEEMTMPEFELVEIPTVQTVKAHFHSQTAGLPLKLRFAGINVHILEIDVRPNIFVTLLALDLGMKSIHSLAIADYHHPRASSRLLVEMPYFPPTITSLHVPAHWTLTSGPKELTHFNSVTSKLILSSFDILTPFDLHLNVELQSLSLNILSSAESFLYEFSLSLPQMQALRQCVLSLLAPELDPDISTALNIISLRSQSLRMLNLKLLPKVWAKPSPQSTIGVGKHPNWASALDSNLALGAVGHQPVATGRSTCTIAGCRCSGYTRELGRHTTVPPCSSIGCGHAATDHRPAADHQTRWLTISLNCPQLTHLTLAGLSQLMDLSSLLRSSPLLTHLQASLSWTPNQVTIAHCNLSTLHLGRMEQMNTLYLKMPKLVRLFVESCPLLSSIVPIPTPLLEAVYLTSTTSITPESRAVITKANPNRPVSIAASPPTKHWFPEMVARL